MSKADVRDHRDKLYLNTFKLVRSALKNWDKLTAQEKMFVKSSVNQAIERLEGPPV